MSDPLILTPLRSPATPKRKALAYAGEIRRLVLEGYTIDAIHEALRDAGVEVSWSSVQRETARVKLDSQGSAATRDTATSQDSPATLTGARAAPSTPDSAPTKVVTAASSTASADVEPSPPLTSPLLRTNKFESWDPRGIDDVLQNPPDINALRQRGLELARINKLERQADAKKTP
jgi:hypothetical protein